MQLVYGAGACAFCRRARILKDRQWASRGYEIQTLACTSCGTTIKLVQESRDRRSPDAGHRRRRLVALPVDNAQIVGGRFSRTLISDHIERDFLTILQGR
jgi:hypothetical protein